jgi:alginate O-acetyltransferase complex protein AlgI
MTRLTRNLDASADAKAAFFIWNGYSVNTEITNITVSTSVAGWLAYDAGCGVCARWVGRAAGILARRNIHPVPLDTPWVKRRLGLAGGEQADRMWLLLPSGQALGGADALIELASRVWWAKPLAALAGLPGIPRLLHAAYGWIARHRHCLGGGCALPAHPTPPAAPAPHHPPALMPFVDCLPAIVLPAAAVAFARELPAWLFMWLLAFAIYYPAKWLMFRRAMRGLAPASRARVIAYFLAWPGLDARAFLGAKPPAVTPLPREWLFTLVKIAFGASLLWGVARCIPEDQPLLAGWAVMIGLIFTLHFGFFHLITLLWRRAGVDAPRMMDNPAASCSVAEFWGRRWNRDFRVLAHEVIFRPLHRRIGAMGAVFLVFLFSALVHDLLISLPARGGFGLPSAYFLGQFAALWFEGTATGKRLGLGRGWCGWCFTAIVTAGPVCFLFHPPFVREVILPFARVIGAV